MLARVVIAASVLAPVLLLLGYHFPRTREGWLNFAVMAVLNNIVPFGLIFFAQTRIPSGLAAVLNAATPLSALLVGRIFAGDALPWNKIVGIGLGMSGVAVLIGPEMHPGGTGELIGMLAVLLATLAYGFSGLWGRRLKAYPPLVSAATQLACSSVLLLPIVAATDRFWALPWPSNPVILSVVALAILSTALAYVIFFRIMASAGSNSVMLVTLLIPFSSIALGAAYLGERLSTQQLIGAAIIGSGLLLIDGRVIGITPPLPARS